MHEPFFGITAELLLAGFCGGYVHAWFESSKSARKVLGSIVAGGFMGNYTGLIMAAAWHVEPIPAAFFAGLTWTYICHKAAHANSKSGHRDD